MGTLVNRLAGMVSLGLLVVSAQAQSAPAAAAQPQAPPAAPKPEPKPATTDANPPAIITEPAGGWHFMIAPYVWLPAMKGNVTLRGRRADVDLDLNDTWDLLTEDAKFAAQGHLEAGKDELTLFADFMYMDLEDREGREVLGTVEVGMKQGIFELGAAYAIIDDHISSADGPRIRLEPLAGARIQYLESSLDVETPNIDASGDETWVDAFGGLRLALQLDRNLSLFARGDVGTGDSDFTWNAVAGIDVHIADWFSFVAGYRGLYTDFSDGHGGDKFEYDITLYGPFVGMVFRF